MHLCLLPHVASPRCLHRHVPPPSRPSPRLPGPPGPPRRQHCNQANFLFEPTLLASQQQLIFQAILGRLF